MKYGLIFETAASATIAAMPETFGELFTLECFTIATDPHGMQGVTQSQDGYRTVRSWAIGGLGFIVYDVDDQVAVVTITIIASLV